MEHPLYDDNINNLYLKIILGLIIATIIYFILNIYFNISVTTLKDPKRSIIQAISYIFIPILWYIFVIHQKPYKAALINFTTTTTGKVKKKQIEGFIEGNLLYLLITLPLFLFCIQINSDTFWWFKSSKNPEYLFWLFYAFISVTSVEFTNKGFVMIPLLQKRVNRILIFGLTFIVWSLGHIVEFLWLSTYVPALYAAFILLQAGITSIISVLRSENLLGVWVGHFLLNVAIVIIVNF